MTVFLEILLALLSFGSVLYYLAGTVFTLRFFRSPPPGPPPDSQPNPQPDLGPVSVLVPVAGLDAGGHENWCSLCAQDYPDYEVLFGVTDAADPAIPTLRRVVEAFPGRARLFVGLPPRGVNYKDSNLSYLLEEARHELIVFSDSDLRVKPDYLRTVVAPLADPKVGMVTCAFIGRRPRSLGAALASLGRCTEFVPGLLIARALDGGLRCAVGATMAMRRDTLAAAGGLHMSRIGSDYNLGHRVARVGYRVELSREVLESDTGRESVAAVFRRELRWARTIRFNRGPLYYAMVFCYGTVFGPWLLPVSGFAAWAAAFVAATYFARFLQATVAAVCMGAPRLLPWLVVLPLRDGLSLAIWACGGVGRTVWWRGRRLLIEGDGLVVPWTKPGRLAEEPPVTRPDRPDRPDRQPGA